MGEAKIYEVLRIPPLEANESFTVLTANSSLAIPARYIEAIELKKSETSKDESIVLSRVDEKAFSNNKIKNAYIRVGNSLILTDDNGEQKAEGTYVLRYYKADVSVGTLVSSVEVTDQFILGTEYEVVLFAALSVAALFFGDVESEQKYSELLTRKIGALNMKEKNAALKGGSFSASVPYPGI
jgi:hypothetical protein